MGQRVERLPSGIDEHAKCKQSRAADSVPTVDQHLVPALNMFADEGDALFEMFMARGMHVGRRQVEKVDPRSPEHRRVVTIFRPEIDDRADAVSLAEESGRFHWKAAADRDLLDQPMEIWRPLFDQYRSFFFIIFHQTDVLLLFVQR